jgi:hypothetical protein
MSLSPACLLGKEEDLPHCTWAQFAAANGIENIDASQVFLGKLAASKYSRSKRERVPDEVTNRALIMHKDPYLLWIWMIDGDFRGSPFGVTPSFFIKDRNNAQEYYLLSIMIEFCKVPMMKQMKELVGEACDDAARYKIVRQLVLENMRSRIPELDIMYE